MRNTPQPPDGFHRLRIGAALLSVILGLAGCADDLIPPPIACTAEARFSIVVFVLDSVTGAGLAPGTTVVLQDGAYSDSSVFGAVFPIPGDSLFYPTNTFERAGTYTVRVRRPGYALWERQGVRVTADQCHVATVRVRARLQPIP